MLFRVEYLEQCRCRIPAPVAAKFVDFVEQDHRIDRFGPPHRLDDTAGQGTDVRAAVPADFRLVAHTTERHTDELPPQCMRNRFAERRLADAGRTDEAENGAGQVTDAPEHGDVIEDALFDFVQPVVVGLEHRAGVIEIDRVVGAYRPRQSKRPVEPASRHGCVGRHRRSALEFPQFPVCPRGDYRRQAALGDLFGELLEFIAVFLAELFVDRPQLLLQVEVALILEE